MAKTNEAVPVAVTLTIFPTIMDRRSISQLDSVLVDFGLALDQEVLKAVYTPKEWIREVKMRLEEIFSFSEYALEAYYLVKTNEITG